MLAMRSLEFYDGPGPQCTAASQQRKGGKKEYPAGWIWSSVGLETGMTKREMVLREVEKAPETLLDEVLGFVRLLRDAPRREALEPAFASERVLGKDWLTPEEDAAWRDL